MKVKKLGGSHAARCSLDRGRVARILLQGVEVAQVTTGAVEEETENLLEEAINGDPFAVYTKTAEKWHNKHLKHLNLINLMDKKRHTTTPGDPLFGRLDLGDFSLAFVLLTSGFAHRIPHFLSKIFLIHIAI